MRTYPPKSMNSQLEAIFRSSGHGDVYDRLLPKKLMNKPIKTIKKRLKKLSTDTDLLLNRTPLTREEYISYYHCAQAIKKRCARKVKRDHAIYVPWKLVKEKVKPIRSGANEAQKNQYVQESAEAYHALRTEYLARISLGNKIEPASLAEVHRLAGLLVAYNGVELEGGKDGTSDVATQISSVFKRLRSKKKRASSSSIAISSGTPSNLQSILGQDEETENESDTEFFKDRSSHLTCHIRKEFCSFGCAVQGLTYSAGLSCPTSFAHYSPILTFGSN